MTSGTGAPLRSKISAKNLGKPSISWGSAWAARRGIREEREHAVAGDIGKGGEFERVVAAGEF